MRAAEGEESTDQIEREVYQDRYLIRRPLLQALQAPEPGAVLLIDEVDRADEPFEAFLLEYLGEYQVSIPEIGTVRAVVPPVTILTSNRTRELNDAVKRRCLYHWLDYPERERELAIVRARVPQAGEKLSAQVAAFVGRLRSQPFANAFQRAPGIAESVEWAKALVALDTLELDPEVVATPPASCSSSARTWRRSRASWPPTCCGPGARALSRCRPWHATTGIPQSRRRPHRQAGRQHRRVRPRAAPRRRAHRQRMRIALAQPKPRSWSAWKTSSTSAPRWKPCWSAASRTAWCSANCSTPTSATPSMANKLLAQMLPSAEGKAEPSKRRPRVREALAPPQAPATGARPSPTRRWSSTPP
jgi:hypothetical protein